MPPKTSKTLLEKLKDKDNHRLWQESWKRFFELYHRPLLAMANQIYFINSGSKPSQAIVEDIVSRVVVEFYSKNQFDPERGNLRGYLRMLTHARTIDFLKKEKRYEAKAYDPHIHDKALNEERKFEASDDRMVAVLAEFRKKAPARHVLIFEKVKLNGMKPEAVAAEFGVKRGVIDNTTLKAMKLLREIAAQHTLDNDHQDVPARA